MATYIISIPVLSLSFSIFLLDQNMFYLRAYISPSFLQHPYIPSSKSCIGKYRDGIQKGIKGWYTNRNIGMVYKMEHRDGIQKGGRQGLDG